MNKGNLFKPVQNWKRNLLFGLVVLSGCLFCGCVPAYYTYWAPSAQGGRLFNSSVSAIAPGREIEFVFNGLKTIITGNGTSVCISINLPRGRNVSFLSDTMEIRWPELRKVKFDVTTVGMTTLKKLRFSPTDNLTGDVVIIAEIKFSSAERSQYTVRMPRIRVDGQIYEIPEITFTRKKAFGVFGP